MQATRLSSKRRVILPKSVTTPGCITPPYLRLNLPPSAFLEVTEG
jgi:hypothetical protein